MTSSALSVSLPVLVMLTSGVPHSDPLFSAGWTPANLHATPAVRRDLAALLNLSPTLRRQAWQIDSCRRVRVLLRLAWPAALETARARTTFFRPEPGVTVALIEVPVGGTFGELVAHEFEHILEQIEGIDLAMLVRERSREVRELHPGVYETRRAKTAERLVRREISARQDGGARRLGRLLRLAWIAPRYAIRAAVGVVHRITARPEDGSAGATR